MFHLKKVKNNDVWYVHLSLGDITQHPVAPRSLTIWSWAQPVEWSAGLACKNFSIKITTCHNRGMAHCLVGLYLTCVNTIREWWFREILILKFGLSDADNHLFCYLFPPLCWGNKVVSIIKKGQAHRTDLSCLAKVGSSQRLWVLK